MRTKVMLLSIMLIMLLNLPVQAQTEQDRIRALAWNPDGTLLAVAGLFDNQPGIQLRDDNGNIIQFLTTSAVPTSASWSPDGTLLATYLPSDGHRLNVIWDVDSSTIVSTFEEIGAKSDDFVHWNPDASSNLLATEETGSVHIRDVMTGDIISTIRPTKIIKSVSTFTWNQDGTQIVTIGDDGFVRAWDALTLEILHETQIEFPTDIALSPDGTQLAVSSRLDYVLILDADTLEIQQVLKGFRGEGSLLLSVRWHPSGLAIAASGFDKISVWIVSTGNLMYYLPLPKPMMDVIPEALDYNPNGHLTYVAANSRIVEF